MKRQRVEPDSEPVFAPVAVSRSMRDILERLGQIADSPDAGAVLIEGEPGVGKRMIAALLHQACRHRPGRFVSLHCADFPEWLLEAELFGREGAGGHGPDGRPQALVAAAEHGTVFLDEVSAVPADLQEKLLRLIDEKRFRCPGGLFDVPSDVLVVAATEEDLPAFVSAGAFRADLHQRLAAHRLVVPPLRERRDDVLPLAAYFLRHYAARLGTTPPRLTGDAVAFLLTCLWPGNVRQLHHVILRAMISSPPEIDAQALVPEVCGSAPVTPSLATSCTAAASADDERRVLMVALAASTGDVEKAAKAMGITVVALRHLMARHSLGDDATSIVSSAR